MNFLSKSEFLKMPKGTIFQKVVRYASYGPMGLKLENSGEEDFFYISLDLVDLLGCTHETHDAFESGAGPLDIGMERDGMLDPDEVYLVLEKGELKELTSGIKELMT